MIKNYLTLCLGSLILSVNAQNASLRNATSVENEPVIIRDVQNAVSTSTVVTLSTKPFTSASTCTSLITGLTANGFNVGTNVYKDKEYSQRYSLSDFNLTTPATINSVTVIFAGGTGAGSVVSKIYSDNLGTPGTLLGTSAPIAVTSCTGTSTTFTFSSAVSITSNRFHVSVELPANYTYTSNTVNGTNLGVIHARNCSDDDTTNTTFYRQNNNTWFNFKAQYPSTYQKVSFAILPTVSASISTDISENQKLNNVFTVFPNPATNQLSISFIQNQKSVKLVNIFDVTGKLVLTTNVQDLLNSNNTITLDLNNLNSGIYMIEAKTDDISVFDKVMISK